MIGRHRAREQRGFTLVELCITVCIAGLIIAALAQVIIHGLTLTPESSARTSMAGDVSQLTVLVSDDVANARHWAIFGPITLAGSGTKCDATPGKTATMLTSHPRPAGQPPADIVAPTYGRTIAAPDADGWRQVVVYRENAVTHVRHDLVVGYCQGSQETFDLQLSGSGRTFTMTLHLASDPGGVVHAIVISADRRTDD